MPMFSFVPVRAFSQAVVLACFLASCPARAAEPPLSIEAVLKQGWDIAGYTGSLILFKKTGESYLVQCHAVAAGPTAPSATAGAGAAKPTPNCEKLQ